MYCFSHKLDYFEAIDFKSLLPSDVNNTDISVLWRTPEDYISEYEAEDVEVDVTKLDDVTEDEQRELTIPPELLNDVMANMDDDIMTVMDDDARESTIKTEPNQHSDDVKPPGTSAMPGRTKQKKRRKNKKAKKQQEEPEPTTEEPMTDPATSEDKTPTTVTEEPTSPPTTEDPVFVDMASVDMEVPEPETPMLRFSVTRTWDGKAMTDPPINVTLSSSDTDTGLLIRLEAPYYEDPPRPMADPRKPYYDIDPHEGSSNYSNTYQKIRSLPQTMRLHMAIYILQVFLFQFSVVAIFFLNDQNKYLEILIGP